MVLPVLEVQPAVVAVLELVEAAGAQQVSEAADVQWVAEAVEVPLVFEAEPELA